jgi:hypothetical protein
MSAGSDGDAPGRGDGSLTFWSASRCGPGSSPTRATSGVVGSASCSAPSCSCWRRWRPGGRHAQPGSDRPGGRGGGPGPDGARRHPLHGCGLRCASEPRGHDRLQPARGFRMAPRTRLPRRPAGRGGGGRALLRALFGQHANAALTLPGAGFTLGQAFAVGAVCRVSRAGRRTWVSTWPPSQARGRPSWR